MKDIGFFIAPLIFLLVQIVVAILGLNIYLKCYKEPDALMATAMLGGFIVLAHMWAAITCILTPISSYVHKGTASPGVAAYIASLAITALIHSLMYKYYHIVDATLGGMISSTLKALGIHYTICRMVSYIFWHNL